MTKGRIARLALGGLSALALAGCAVHLHPYYGHGRAPVATGIVYVGVAPPAPRRVVMPPRPSTTAVWIGGYWSWTGVQYVWVDGRWDLNPPAGRTWAPGRWTHTNQGWYWTPGRYR